MNFNQLESNLNVSERLKNNLDRKQLDSRFYQISMNLCLLRFETRLNNYRKIHTSTLSLDPAMSLKDIGY